MAFTQALLSIDNINAVCALIQSNTLYTTPSRDPQWHDAVRTNPLIQQVQQVSMGLPAISTGYQPPQFDVRVQSWMLWDAVKTWTSVVQDNLFGESLEKQTATHREFLETVCSWIQNPQSRTGTRILLGSSFDMGNPFYVAVLEALDEAYSIAELQTRLLGFYACLYKTHTKLTHKDIMARLGLDELRGRFYHLYRAELPEAPAVAVPDVLWAQDNLSSLWRTEPDVSRHFGSTPVLLDPVARQIDPTHERVIQNGVDYVTGGDIAHFMDNLSGMLADVQQDVQDMVDAAHTVDTEMMSGTPADLQQVADSLFPTEGEEYPEGFHAEPRRVPPVGSIGTISQVRRLADPTNRVPHTVEIPVDFTHPADSK